MVLDKNKSEVISYRVIGNVLELKLTNCKFNEGEVVDIDNERARITGRIIKKLNNAIRVRIVDIKEKNVNYS